MIVFKTEIPSKITYNYLRIRNSIEPFIELNYKFD